MYMFVYNIEEFLGEITALTSCVNMAILPLFFILLYGPLSAVHGNANNTSILNLQLWQFLGSNMTDKCYPNNQWYLFKSFQDWRFAGQQMLASTFSIDTERRNYVREVRGALFSEVYPTALKNPKLAAVSEDVLAGLMDLDPRVKYTNRFTHFVSGNILLPGVKPLSHRYGGHQFGYWADQLGDGRAVMVGEYVNHLGDRWEFQLKGSGLTPYSRRGDGKAVIRSSVREFLCSEAMHALGIPTSRAASLVVSEDHVIRDQFYNGNMRKERAAIVLRLAESWFRIGSLEILTTNNEISLLRDLVDFIIDNYFPNISLDDPDRYLAFFQEVVQQTALMIALWQSVGFTHGVCNTDNFSILSITIDYGPFGFLEAYDPTFVPNTSDDEGRYSYEKQPDVGKYNLNKLRLALSPLLTKRQTKPAKIILNGYADIYKSKFMKLVLEKLGFENHNSYSEDDEQLIAILLKIMEDTRADFTMTFRELSEISLDVLYENIKQENIPAKWWTLKVLGNHDWFNKWVAMYMKKLSDEGIAESKRQNVMLKINPRYILRNWIAQTAIKQTEQDNFDEVNFVLNVLQNPYTYNKMAEDKGYASLPPTWARKLKVSCSS